MNPEKAGSGKQLIRWLLSAAIALLLLVLALQLRQIIAGKAETPPPVQDAQSVSDPLDSSAASVSPGKTAMIEDVQSLNPALAFDDLSALSAGELEQLYETGAPGLPIGRSRAAYLAEEYAGTLAVNSVTWDADPELDESPAHYEVELHLVSLGDFEYKIDAYTGEVLSGQADLFQSVSAAGTPDTSSGTLAPAQSQAPQASAAETQLPSPQASGTQSGSGLIGEDAAKAAAFTHAGVDGTAAAGLCVKLDWEDRVQVYEIEFTAGDRKYDYEIDAVTGEVRKAEQEDTCHSQTASPQSSGFIGAEAAENAALAHAGVSRTGAGRIQCELDQDDDRWFYEIEFRSGSLEYEYEIDAATGGVLKAELDS